MEVVGSQNVRQPQCHVGVGGRRRIVHISLVGNYLGSVLQQLHGDGDEEGGR